MSGGRERGIMEWDVRVTLLRERLDQIERELAHLNAIEEPPTRKRREHVSELESERQRVRTRLTHLGPSPRAKMG